MKRYFSVLVLVLCIVSGCSSEKDEGIPSVGSSGRIEKSEPVSSALAGEVRSSREDNLFWREVPEIVAVVVNGTRDDVKDVRFDLKVYDAYSEVLHATETLSIPSVPSGQTETASLTMDLPYGVHRIEWRMYDDDGDVQRGETKIGRAMAPCLQGASTAVKEYVRETFPFGGDFGQLSPEFGGSLGARWARFPADDVEETVLAAKEYLANDIEPMCRFEPEAHGDTLSAVAKATEDVVDNYELGDRDAESCRHAAAAIRKESLSGLIGSECPTTDGLTPARDRERQNILERLDALCVQPEIASVSPELSAFDDARKCWSVVDQAGGMKYVWAMDFAQPESMDEKKLAEWVPAQLQIGVGGGYDKLGLLSELPEETSLSLAAISTHTMMKMLEGYRFAGVLERKDDQWVVLWEKFGKPILICWSPTGEKTLRVPVGEQPVQVFDLFGNPLPMDIREGWLYMDLTFAPQYVVEAPWDPTMYAWGSTLEGYYHRYLDHLKESTLSDDPILLEVGSEKKRATTQELWDALVHISSEDIQGEVNDITAVQANMLRLLLQQVKMGMGQDLLEDATSEAEGFTDVARSALDAAASEDMDVPALRWVLSEFRRYDLERQVAIKEKATEADYRLLVGEAVLAKFGKELIIDRERFYRFSSVWPSLFSTSEDGRLTEGVSFVAGQDKPVKMRVSSYASNDYSGTVSVELPEDWTCSPESHQVEIPAGGEAMADFVIHPGTDIAEQPEIFATLQIDGKPVVRIPAF